VTRTDGQAYTYRLDPAGGSPPTDMYGRELPQDEGGRMAVPLRCARSRRRRRVLCHRLHHPHVGPYESCYTDLQTRLHYRPLDISRRLSIQVSQNSIDITDDRIQIRSGSLDQFPSLFRRLSRIFSHAYYHHRETFHLAEAETSLYARFVALCEKYDLVGSNLLVIPRHVVADTLDGKSPEIEVEEEDEQEDEEEEDEEEEDEAEERDSRSRDKGESGRRPHSLDRHARPHKLDEWRPTLEGTVKGKPTPEPETQPPSYSPPTEDASSSSTTYTNPDPISLSTSQTYSLKPRFPRESSKVKQQIKEARNEREIGTLGRSTLGKKSRGTMLWTSDTDTPAKDTVSTPTAETPEAELERTDSVETAILAPSDLEGDGPVSVSLRTEVGGEDDDEEVAVPKDEIELLEEEGVLETEEAVSPLPPTATLSASTDDQAETKLEADNKPESEAEMEGSEPIIESEPAAHDIVVPEPDLETKSVAEIEPTASPTQEQPVIEMEDKEKGDSEATDDERNKGGKKKKDKKDKA
jgi:hypothetical protein